MAGNRCTECNRFVSTEIEITDVCYNESELLENTFSLQLTLSLSKICSECGAELAYKDIDISTKVEIDPADLKGDWETV
jgi:hypothetical protein